MDICRAITFYNYHIPMALDAKMKMQYTTIGYFDGMNTEKIDVSFQDKELKQLWYYGLKETARNEGQYSFQNIFCFSKDAWNKDTDDIFWEESTNKSYPLTFVSFLQLKNYASGMNSIEQQCKTFNIIIEEELKNDGMFYTYSTIDKNDFVICLKCKNYQKALEVIKRLHKINQEVVYSYTVFSVSGNVLQEINGKKYEYLFQQTIDSICLKGITNSYDPKKEFTLDQKYYQFCIELGKRLYVNENIDDLIHKGVFRIYDILGDDDFRLIAREVNLGILLNLFAQNEILCYEGADFRFYLFSSKLVLNIKSISKAEISLQQKKLSYEKMEIAFQAPICSKLQKRMKEISDLILKNSNNKNEKVLAFCFAIWQLLQSLKALESAPTKKYDFLSIYQPFALMVDILEEKIEAAKESKVLEKELGESEEVYDFIYKISTTLHGTLRTDIQFFQIKDFNVILHYAPAKLRAFYSMWALKLSDYYNQFADKKNSYSFILSSGMFSETRVKQLFTSYKESKRLMLITVPERHLYSPMCLSIILGHEVSHFVGSDVRKRDIRHKVWLECLARLLILEWNRLRYEICYSGYQTSLELKMGSTDLFNTLKNYLIEEEKIVRKAMSFDSHEYHSENSFLIIRNTFGEVHKKHIAKIVADNSITLNKFLRKNHNIDTKPDNEKYIHLQEIRKSTYAVEEQMVSMFSQFQGRLKEFWGIFRHITSEAHADLNVILTLNLTPKEYILSFVQSELNFVEEKNSGFVDLVRMGLTIEAVCRGIERWKDSIKDVNFYQEWNEDIWGKLFEALGTNSIAFGLLVKIYTLKSEIRDCNKEISNYSAVYNYVQLDFSNRKWDFLKDKIIWNLLSQYLDECVSSYMERLVNDREEGKGLYMEKQRIVDTYKKMAGDSCMEMVQEVENYLANYEKQCIDVLLKQ